MYCNYYKLSKSKLIFIHYVPGSYGSLVFHLLCKNTNYFQNYFPNYPYTEIYQKDNTAHNNVFDIINNFHGDEEVTEISKMSIQEKKDFFSKNLNKKFQISELLQPPMRIASYKGLDITHNFFPESKNIVIFFKKESIQILVSILKNKLLHKKNVNLNLKKLTLLQKYKHNKNKDEILDNIYADIFKHFFESQKNIILTKNDIVLNFEDFFKEDLFIFQIKDMYDKLGINFDKNSLINFYSKFFNVNKIHFNVYKQIYS